jgi:hypothetical protein
MARILPTLLALVACGCWHASALDEVTDAAEDASGDADTDTDEDADSDSDADSDVDMDTDTDADTDVDTDTDTDGDGDADTDAGDAGSDSDTGTNVFDAGPDASPDAGMIDCAGGKLDSYTKLCWQDPPSDETPHWDTASSYCKNLNQGGHTDWRLPTITELCSLVRGCPAVWASGKCGVPDAGPWHSYDCPSLEGPGTSGCYWDPELSGECLFSTWSSSFVYPYAPVMWFSNANVYYAPNSSYEYVRCVRDGP